MKRDPELIGLPLDLLAEEAAAQFDLLQKKLVPLWRSIECFNQDEQTIVVVPSISLEMAVTGFEVQGYEERFLFLLLLLAQPRARLAPPHRLPERTASWFGPRGAAMSAMS